MDSQKPQVGTLIRTDHSPVFFRVTKDGEIITPDSNGSEQEHYLLPKNHLEIVRRCFDTGHCIRNVCSENGTISMHWDYFPFIHEECIHVYGTPIDTGISVKTSLTTDQSLLQSLYNAPDAVIIYDGSLQIVYTNLKVTTLLGYHKSELVGKSISEIIPSKILKQYPLIHDLPSGEASQIRDIVLLRKNGSLVEVESNEKILSGNRNIIILRENIEHKRSRREFNEALRSELYEKLFIKLRLFKHGEGMIMNLHRIALFIENANSLHNQYIFERFINAAREYQKIIYSELKSIGEMLKILDHGDQEYKHADSRLPSGDLILEHSNRLMGLFKQMTNVMQHNDRDDWLKFMQKYRYTIVDSITDIISDITETTTIIEKHFVCLPGDIIQTVVNKYNVGIRRSTIQVVDTMSEKSVIMNAAELGEVLEILIENAFEELLQYKKDKKTIVPKIEIKLVPSNSRVHIEVEDNGPGVPKEYQSLLFREGFTTKGPGHGFGLSYAAKCVQKYGGELSYMPALDSGARFVITLLRTYSD